MKNIVKKITSKKIMPKYYIEKIINLDPLWFSKNGYENILFDLDNTLSPNHVLDMPEDVKIFLMGIKNSNVEVYIISNNYKERVANYVGNLNIKFLNSALKPLKKRTKLFMKLHNISQKKTILVGDQLYTDIKLANKLKIDSILVEPLFPRESWKTSYNRKKDVKIRPFVLENVIKL